MSSYHSGNSAFARHLASKTWLGWSTSTKLPRSLEWIHHWQDQPHSFAALHWTTNYWSLCLLSTLLLWCCRESVCCRCLPTVHATWSTLSTAHLVFGKTQLTPTKPITIPCLELMAIVLGIRCLWFVRTQLHLPLEWQDTLWSDSQCALGWLRSPPSKLPLFIVNCLR